jgi:hypothetical protein
MQLIHIHVNIIELQDRTYVFTLIKRYCSSMSNVIITQSENAVQLMLLKMQFIRIVCSHEHYLILNLPFLLTPSKQSSTTTVPVPHSISPSPSLSSRSSLSSAHSIGAAELSLEYRQKHFLVGLVLSDLATSLDTGARELCDTAVGMVCGLLAAHDADARVQVC